MGGWGSPLHWIVLLVVVLLVFGTKKLRNIGSDLGSAVKGFKDGMKGASEQPPPEANRQDGSHILEGEIKDKVKN